MEDRRGKKNDIAAPVYEIFTSWQGEGLFAGRKQIFVRFSGCNLSCSFCDEPASRKKAASMSAAAAAGKIRELAVSSGTRFVSFTGGEPLLYADFINDLISRLRGKSFRFFLETNGSLPEELKKVISGLCVVSMDIKLPSFCGRELWEDHRKFLRAAGGKAYVKVVVSPRTPAGEFKRAVKLVEEAGRETPFFIQPESSALFKGRRGGAVFEAYEKFYRLAAVRLCDVSVLPQLHKLWGIR